MVKINNVCRGLPGHSLSQGTYEVAVKGLYCRFLDETVKVSLGNGLNNPVGGLSLCKGVVFY